MSDTGAIAMPIRAGLDEEILIVAVAGLSRRISEQEDKIIRAMRKMLQ